MPRLIRLLTRSPGSSAAAILMAGIGIALLTLGLAVADATRWRPIPFPRDVVMLHSTQSSPRDVRTNVRWSYPRLQYVRDHATTVDRVTSWSPTTLTLAGRDEPQRINGEFVSRDYFSLLGTQPVAGRTFTADEDVAGSAQPVVVVSEGFRRRRRLAGDPVDLGTTLRLNGRVVTVVGILPEPFRGLSNHADLWLPTPLAPALTYPEYLTTNQDFITLLARRRAGVDDNEMQQEVAALAAAADRVQHTDEWRPDVTISGRAEPLQTARVRKEGALAATLALTGSALLYLLTLANLVSLLLTRALARRRETAVRMAMGATAARVWRTSAIEGATVVGVGAVLAIVSLSLWFGVVGTIDPIATVGRHFLATFSAVGFDLRLVAWWLAASVLALGVASVLPSWWSVTHARMDHLREGAHGSAASGVSLRRPGIGAAIVAIEAALAMVLIAAAGQFLESYRRMQRADVGVDAEHVLTFELQPSERAVPPERAVAFIDNVLASIRTVPGVLSASVDGGAPLAGSASGLLHIVGRPEDPVAGPPPVLLHYVSAQHLETLGIPLRGGRNLTDADRGDAPRVALISESAARLYFPGGNAIGRRIWFDGSVLTSPDSSGEIVGIVGDVKYDPLLRERTTASFYTPYPQFTYGWRVYFVRVSGDPRTMTRVIGEAVHRVAPDLPLLNVRPLADLVAASSDAPRRAAGGTGILGVLGLLLAVSGIWAVVSHATAQRTRDLAIRIAHGASAGRVVRLILADGLSWPLAGLIGGAVLTMATSGVLRAVLYDVSPGDPLIVLGGAAMFLAVATGACLWPAWRASRVNPIAVLRSD